MTDLKQFDLLEKQKLVNMKERKLKDITHTNNLHMYICTNVSLETKKHCCCCKGYHTIYHCEKFLKLNTNDRITQVKKSALCINCWKPNHFLNDYQAYSRRKCNKNYKSLLQFNNAYNENKPETEVSITSHILRSWPSEVLLSTVLLYVKESKCRNVPCTYSSISP